MWGLAGYRSAGWTLTPKRQRLFDPCLKDRETSRLDPLCTPAVPARAGTIPTRATPRIVWPPRTFIPILRGDTTKCFKVSLYIHVVAILIIVPADPSRVVSWIVKRAVSALSGPQLFQPGLERCPLQGLLGHRRPGSHDTTATQQNVSNALDISIR